MFHMKHDGFPTDKFLLILLTGEVPVNPLNVIFQSSMVTEDTLTEMTRITSLFELRLDDDWEVCVVLSSVVWMPCNSWPNAEIPDHLHYPI